MLRFISDIEQRTVGGKTGSEVGRGSVMEQRQSCKCWPAINSSLEFGESGQQDFEGMGI